MKKIAIVTGASSGMGLEAVKQIIAKYTTLDEVWVLARRTERLDSLAASVRKCKVVCITADLTKECDREILFGKLQEEKPFVKILVNAAGFGQIGKFMGIDAQKSVDMCELNCVALTDITHMCLKYMHAGSRILQFASAAAFMPQPEFAVYAATKAYVLSFSRALNKELKKRRITVTAVCPGPVKTEFFDVAQTTGKMKAYKMLAMADAKEVVAKAIVDAEEEKDVSVYGLPMQIFRVLAKIIPHRWLLFFF